MGQILIKNSYRTETRYLLESNVLGRDRSLGSNRLPNRHVPLFWVEIRYFQGSWAWRVLNGEAQTRGSGAVLGDGWRKFSHLIRFQEVVIELLDPSSPKSLIEDLQEGKLIPLEEIDELLVNEDGYFLCEEQTRKLENFEIFVLEDQKPYRLWIPEGIEGSFVRPVSVSDELYLDCDLKNLHALFSSKNAEIRCSGEVIRLLTVYAQERKSSEEGWLNNEQVFERWLELGGNSSSELKRMNWERNKLCNQLYQAGLAKTMGLFEKKRVGVTWYHRLNLEPKQIDCNLG